MGFLPDAGEPYCHMLPTVLASETSVTTFCYGLAISPLSVRYRLRGSIQPDEFSWVEPQPGDALQKLRS